MIPKIYFDKLASEPTGAVQFMEHIYDLELVNAEQWWHRAALDAFNAGRYRFIRARNSNDLYLARFWLTDTQKTSEGDFESADSIMLHYFAQGDDDGSLHDHPWQFSTQILSGGYLEHLPAIQPTSDMGTATLVGDSWENIGPELAEITVERLAGDRVHHAATDLHMACNPLPDTWTLVCTGERCRDWGFHPPGKAWQGWREFLQLEKATA